jgi:hypothetical protein
MGRVRSAFDTVNRRRIALKTIHPRCAGMTHLEDRFRREGWALAAIEHPGVPILFESSAEPEPFFTMEIVDGVTLAAVLRQARRSSRCGRSAWRSTSPASCTPRTGSA